mmetsp:Transcript_126385/g.369275  ORF Transcript_126385/g.369275 Transcript_126385/m.369275 type:complete len:348 (-) Transcript_126385:21-1064(-)
MPTVLCSLGCFDISAPCTAGDVAHEFIASLDPGLEAAGCHVEVYRLERALTSEVPVGPEDLVLCRLPAWSFDLEALEDLHAQLEELQEAHEGLKAQHASVSETLVALNASVEAREAKDAARYGCELGTPRTCYGTGTPRTGLGTPRTTLDTPRTCLGTPRTGLSTPRTEVELLRQQFALNERKQQETQASVKALRSQFSHIVELWGEANRDGFQDARLDDTPESVPRTASARGPAQERAAGVNRVVQLLTTQASSWAQETSRSPRRVEAERPLGSRGAETARSTPTNSQKLFLPPRAIGGPPPLRPPCGLRSPRAGAPSRGPAHERCCVGRGPTAGAPTRRVGGAVP